MKDQEYQKELGATTAYAICTGEGTMQVKEVNTMLIGDASFESVKVAAMAVKRKHGSSVPSQVKS